MQKVVGSSPIIRFAESPCSGAASTPLSTFSCIDRATRCSFLRKGGNPLASTSTRDVLDAVSNGKVTATMTTPEGINVHVAKPLETDTWIYRIVVLVLGLAILAVIAGALVLKVIDSATGIPDVLVAIGTGALGALAGLLAPTPGTKAGT